MSQRMELPLPRSPPPGPPPGPSPMHAHQWNSTGYVPPLHSKTQDDENQFLYWDFELYEDFGKYQKLVIHQFSAKGRG